MRMIVLLGAALVAAGCSESPVQTEAEPLSEAISEERSVTYTLYRNSDLSRELRVHWASFDADDLPGYNLSNCQMAARLLNANITQSAEADGKRPYQSVGFWCEEGKYREEGDVPLQFDSAFPTDAS
ncbi:hypothetical protein KUV75_01560 [Qipengyuania gaetbuli]|uniref:hypothetical protein n=1 Tax=Qipengyuania gaetbuli TaxID=266952 RepID=UPI001C99CBD4|nr:hypothetical protein [Qipengyuania gaetbuli]MBY6013590.1 hypothetical protein [Qipengyuania gaetbuli]